jgi:peroxiredoxin Q/BCP
VNIKLPRSGLDAISAVDLDEFPASLSTLARRTIPAPWWGDRTMSVQEGDVAPDFEMPASGGRTVSLAAVKGKPFILYFYPKADTPGCTKEACAFQEALPQLGDIGLDVIGVSPDKMKPIDKFAEKYGLKFPLASDETKTVAEKYGTWVEKSMYGRKYMGMERSTFLVGADGKVKKVWRKVSVTGHAADVIKAAEALK